MSFLSEKAYLLLHADGIDGGGSLGDDGGAAGAGVAGRGLGGKRNLAGLEGEGGHFFLVVFVCYDRVGAVENGIHTKCAGKQGWSRGKHTGKPHPQHAPAHLARCHPFPKPAGDGRGDSLAMTGLARITFWVVWEIFGFWGAGYLGTCMYHKLL